MAQGLGPGGAAAGPVAYPGAGRVRTRPVLNDSNTFCETAGSTEPIFLFTFWPAPLR